MLIPTTFGWPRRWRTGVVVLTGAAILATAISSRAAPWTNRFAFADPAFQAVWLRSDSDVANGSVARSFTWGPNPWFDYKEYYRQSPNGLRQVQYFDKARMEINDPARSGPDGVTNGLLTVELVSGRVKLGDSPGPDDNLPRSEAYVPVAGDPFNALAPTYESFRSVATVDNGYRDPDRTGQRIGTTLDRNGNRANNTILAEDQATEIVAYNTVTGHNVPRVFRDFVQTGPVDALFAFGYPITDPYWIRANVGGVEKDIFVQLYERRVVTYTPDNPAGFQVEMGNVGQHYFQWRYNTLGRPWAAPDPAMLIAFASKRDSAEFNVYVMDSAGKNQQPLTSNRDPQTGQVRETVPFSAARSWDPTYTDVWYGDSKYFSEKRQLSAFALVKGQRRPVPATGPWSVSDSNDYNMSVSPDQTKFVFVSDRDGNPELYLRSLYSTVLIRLTDTIGCSNQYPNWLPDGSGIVYESSCQDGNFEIYCGDLSYTEDTFNAVRVGRLISPQSGEATRLTTNRSDDRFPRVSPDGTKVIFASNRNGAGELYMINVDGTGETRLTSDPADDGSASWSPDGTEIVFDSNRDGDYEIYRLELEAGFITQLTVNDVDDRWPIWAQ